MRNRHILYQGISVLIISLMFISGCSSSESIAKVPPAKINPSDAQIREYLSITNTEYVNGTDPNDGMNMNVYTYDLQTKALNKMTDFPYNSQYPLTVVWQKTLPIIRARVKTKGTSYSLMI